MKKLILAATVALGLSATPALAQTTTFGGLASESSPDGFLTMAEDAPQQSTSCSDCMPTSRTFSIDLWGTTFGTGEAVAAANGEHTFTETFATKEGKLLLEGNISTGACQVDCSALTANALGYEQINTGAVAYATGTTSAASGVANRQTGGVNLSVGFQFGSAPAQPHPGQDAMPNN